MNPHASWPAVRLAALLVLGAAAVTTPAMAQQDSFFENVDFYGDARLRLEFNDNANPAVDRHRQRMRFRFGANWTVTDEVTVGARVRTGNPDDPNSPHVDLGDVFDSLEFNLDRAFVRYAPQQVPGLAVVGGKFDLPMVRNPVYGEYMWDADVQPEGALATWTCAEVPGFAEVGAMAGALALVEQGSSEESWGSFAQVHGTVEASAETSVEGALAYFFVGDPTPGGSNALVMDNQFPGNAVSGGEYVSDFGVLNPMVAVRSGALTGSGEVFHNLRAADGQGDTGFALGGAWSGGNAGKFYYSYASIEEDAIFSPFGNDDFLMSTNTESHVVGWKKQLSERIQLHVWAMASEAEDPAISGPSDTIYRFRTDLNISL